MAKKRNRDIFAGDVEGIERMKNLTVKGMDSIFVKIAIRNYSRKSESENGLTKRQLRLAYARLKSLIQRPLNKPPATYK